MDMKIMIILIVMSLFFIGGCTQENIYNHEFCDSSCNDLGYGQGTCEELPVIEKPCESIGKFTMFSDEPLCEQLDTDLVGVDVMCCCDILGGSL